MPDYTEVLQAIELAKGKAADPLAMLAAHARGSRMVALQLDELLKSDEWNTFLSHVKALIEADESELAGLRNQFERGGLAPDDLFRLSNRFQRLLGRVEARKEDLDLPRTVIAQDQQVQVGFAKNLDNAGGEPVTG